MRRKTQEHCFSHVYTFNVFACGVLETSCNHFCDRAGREGKGVAWYTLEKKDREITVLLLHLLWWSYSLHTLVMAGQVTETWKLE